MTSEQLESVRKARLELLDAGRRADFLDWAVDLDGGARTMYVEVKVDTLSKDEIDALRLYPGEVFRMPLNPDEG